MKNLLFYITLFFFTVNSSIAQDYYYLIENWETDETQIRWEKTPIIPGKEWKFTYGGQWESGGDPYYPTIPKQGLLNAGIYYSSPYLDSIMIISPQLELEAAKKPTLRFWHCQYYKPPKGSDELYLFFRVGPNSHWDTIFNWNSAIEPWAEEIFDIEDIDEKYLTDSFQIGFQAYVGTGYGIYLDSITVKEDAVLDKFVKKATYESLEYEAIPSGATDIPLEKITLQVIGNQGNANLDSITVIPVGTGVDYLEENDFKLYYAYDDEFSPIKSDTSTVIATASISGGKVVFADLNQELRLGNNYFWVSASFKPNLSGEANINFQVPAEGIQFNDSLFPASAVNFDENHLIKEVVYYNDFESGVADWSLEGDFEVGIPVGNLINSVKNPSNAFNGNNVLATDLDSGYYVGIREGISDYYAYSPEVNLKYYIHPAVYFHSYISINGPDEAVMEYSTNGGATWERFWVSQASNNNAYWREYSNGTFGLEASRKDKFQLRFGITHSETTRPGLAFDNFAIIAEKLHTDVGVVRIPTPFDECIDCGNDTVKAWIKNFADGSAPDTIPLYYGLWGMDSTRVYDTLFGGINKDDSVLFTFNSLAGFPRGDFYDKFVIGVDLPGDQDPLNDTLTKSLIIQNNYSSPNIEQFEYKGGIWLTHDSARWQAIPTANTGSADSLSPSVWILAETGKYIHDDSTYVISGCYDLSATTRNILQFKYWSNSELQKDGARIEYSKNDGLTWHILDDPVYGNAWGWLPDTVEALKSRGWSGVNDWTTTRALLPIEIDTVKKTKFRVLFMSDAANSLNFGFAFDDFEIYTAPHDIGVQNYGYNTLEAGDTVIVGVDFETDQPVIDTLVLAASLTPGDSVDLTVNTNIDIAAATTYNITAYTLIEDDPWFYLANNDTATYSFEVWPNPVTELVDTISSRTPKDVVIRPYAVTPGTHKFLWYDMSTADTHTVEVSDFYYSVRVTDTTHGCYTYDSVYVELLYNDIGVDSVIWPASTCELTNSELVQVQIRNHGTDSLRVNDEFTVYFQLDGGQIFQDTITLTESFMEGAAMWHTFNDTALDFTDERDYLIHTGAIFGGDTLATNDTISSVITVFGYTPIDIGADTIVPALGLTLDASPVFSSYSWSTGDTTQTTFIDASTGDPSGKYYVDVVDMNGCAGSDSLNVWFKIRDVEIYDIYSPAQTLCEPMDSLPLTVRIYNVGNDTIFTTDSIDYTYRIDGGAINSLRAAPDNDLVPGEQYTITLDNEISFSVVKDYIIEITASAVGDLKAFNDSIADTLTTNARPIVDLGDYPNPISGFEYLLDAGAGDYSYLWQDGVTTSQTYLANSSREKYWVTVTDNVTGCQGSDATTILFDFLDFKVESIDGIGSQECRGEEKTVTVYVANLGTQPRSDMELTIGFLTNGGTPVYENHSFPGVFEPGTQNKRSVELSNTAAFETVGAGFIKVFVDHVDDIRKDDTLNQAVTVDASPIVDFGGDTLNVPVPYTLDAGDHRTYEWQDGFDGRYYTVSSTIPQLYTVIVTDDGVTCVTQESVFIDPATGLRDNNADNLDVNLYPNPASEFLNIEVEELEGKELYIELYSISNQVVWSDYHEGYGAYTYKLDISGFKEGVYLLRFRNSETNYIQRIIIR
jgi:hypothetical protein